MNEIHILFDHRFSAGVTGSFWGLNRADLRIFGNFLSTKTSGADSNSINLECDFSDMTLLMADLKFLFHRVLRLFWEVHVNNNKTVPMENNFSQANKKQKTLFGCFCFTKIFGIVFLSAYYSYLDCFLNAAYLYTQKDV